MSGNSIGKSFVVTTFGESHGPALGCIVDGCPPGLALSESDIQGDLDRRRPGRNKHTTQRNEPDQVRIGKGPRRYERLPQLLLGDAGQLAAQHRRDVLEVVEPHVVDQELLQLARDPVLVPGASEEGDEGPGLVVGDAWSDFLPGSKDLIADLRKPLSCGNYNVKTAKCSGQNY